MKRLLLSTLLVASIAILCSVAPAAAAQSAPGKQVSSLSPSGPIVINGRNGSVIQGLKITSTSGDCVRIVNSKNITIQNSEIGPCGGDGVFISGSSAINIFDSYIHPETQSPGCCDHNDGVFALEPANLVIQGNVIAYGEANIVVHGGDTVSVIGNFLLNPRGPYPRGQNFQCWTHAKGAGAHCRNVTVSNNYALSSTDTSKYLYPEDTEDSINFGFTEGALAQNNFIVGGHSKSGCALIADRGGNNVQFLNNRILDSGQCGIGISDGMNQVVDNNKVLIRNPVPGGGNQGIYVWQSYKEKGECGTVKVTNNVTLALKPDGTKSGFWKGKGCDPMTFENNASGPAAAKLLNSVDQIFAPPLVPPQPKNCVVASPYSTQTSAPACVTASGQ